MQHDNNPLTLQAILKPYLTPETNLIMHYSDVIPLIEEYSLDNDNQFLGNPWILQIILKSLLTPETNLIKHYAKIVGQKYDYDVIPLIEEYTADNDRIRWQNTIEGENLYQMISLLLKNKYITLTNIADKIDNILNNVVQLLLKSPEICNTAGTLYVDHNLRSLKDTLECAKRNQQTYKLKWPISLPLAHKLFQCRILEKDWELYPMHMSIFLMSAQLFVFDNQLPSYTLAGYCLKLASDYNDIYYNQLQWKIPLKNPELLDLRDKFTWIGHNCNHFVEYFLKERPACLNDLEQKKLLEHIDSIPQAPIWSRPLRALGFIRSLPQDSKETIMALTNTIQSIRLSDPGNVNFLKNYILGLGKKLSDKTRETLLEELENLLQLIESKSSKFLQR